MLTGNEDIFIRGSDELHGFLGEQRHELVNGIVGNVFVGTVVQGDEDIQKYWQSISSCTSLQP